MHGAWWPLGTALTEGEGVKEENAASEPTSWHAEHPDALKEQE